MKSSSQSTFIDAFVDFHKNRPTSRLFALWTGIWLVSAAVERRVNAFTAETDLYPNLVVFLVGPAGLGKSVVLDTATDLLNGLGREQLSKESMSGAYIGDALKGSPRSIVDTKTGKATSYNAVNIIVSDLQTLLSSWDYDIIAKLTRLYDAQSYGEGRRARDNKDERTFDIPRAVLTMLAGTTEVHLTSVLPETAWGTGLMARTILVVGGEVARPHLFNSANRAEIDKKKAELQKKLKVISEAHGEVIFDEEAREALNAFWQYKGNMGGPPIPTHPRLRGYCTRRHSQLEKLMIISAIDRNPKDRVVMMCD